MKTSLSPTLSALCGALLLAMAGSACSGVSNSTSAPAAPSASGPLQQLQAAIGDAACDSAQQCKTVAVGHKACGGPERYLAWSTKATDGAKIASLASAYAAQRKSDDTKAGMISNCALVMDPGATCSAGRCIPAAGAGSNLAR